MKKISLVALLLATAGGVASAETLVPGCPKAFQGFHLGGNIGYGVGTANQKFFVGEGDEDDAQGIKNKLGVSGVDGGIGVGYTHRFGNWALGLAFDANWASTSGDVRTFAVDDDESQAARAKARLKNSLQLYARGGYVIGGQVMPFIGLGWDNSSWSQSGVHFVDGEAERTKGKSKRFNAFLWKAGVDFLATKHVVLGLEYTGTIAGSKKFRRVDEDGDAIAAASFRPQYNKFALTAKIVY